MARCISRWSSPSTVRGGLRHQPVLHGAVSDDLGMGNDAWQRAYRYDDPADVAGGVAIERLLSRGGAGRSEHRSREPR